MRNFLLAMSALLGIVLTIALGIGVWRALLWAGADGAGAGFPAVLSALAFLSIATIALFDEACK